MTPDEMRTAEPKKYTESRFEYLIRAAFICSAELCERLDTAADLAREQNAVLVRIAEALEKHEPTVCGHGNVVPCPLCWNAALR